MSLRAFFIPETELESNNSNWSVWFKVFPTNRVAHGSLSSCLTWAIGASLGQPAPSVAGDIIRTAQKKQLDDGIDQTLVLDTRRRRNDQLEANVEPMGVRSEW